jgi:hypothetical protein
MKIDLDFAKSLLDRAGELGQAQILEGSTQAPLSIIPLTLALDTARLSSDPYKIGFPFKSIYVSAATDATTSVNFKPVTRDEVQGAIPLTLKDAHSFQKMINQGFLYWSAQPGKTITLMLLVDSEFRSGSQINLTAGGVSVTEGSSSTLVSVNLSAATAAIIVPQNVSRFASTIQNQTGGDLWIGDSTVTNAGATQGIKIANGDSVNWRNTGALYGYSVGGGRVNRLDQT